MGMSLEDLSQLGDPDGMEALASDLFLRAEAVAGIAQGLSRQIDEIAFVGPAAAALRTRTADRRRRAEKAAAELDGLARALKVRAAEVRDAIHYAEAAQRRAQEPER